MAVPILFEVGLLTSTGTDRTPTAKTLLIFPLLPDPSSVAWSNPPRDDIQQTVGGATHTKSGRGLATCQISGTFGVDDRAYGLIGGSGKTRLQRFQNEVVALGYAVSVAEVDEVIRNAAITAQGVASNITDFVTDAAEPSKPGNLLSKQLRGFDPDLHITYLNVYDFYNRRFHRVGKLDFRNTLSARGGGAVEMQQYQLSFTAYGPPIVDVLGNGGIQSDAVKLLTDILPTWQNINSFLKSATVTSALDSAASILADVAVSPIAESLDAINTQIESLTSLAGGGIILSTAGISSLLGSIAEVKSQLEYQVDLITGNTDSFEPDPVTTEIDWSEDVEEPRLDEFNVVAHLIDTAQSLGFQRLTGRFMGMSDTEYAAFLEAGGNVGGAAPVVATTLEYTVNANDTPDSISARFGVSWLSIVRVNRLRMSDFVPGAVLQIPKLRAWGPQAITGLPVFGSHIATGALGSDLLLPMEVDSSGDFATVSGISCLEQGATLRQYGIMEQVLDGTAGVDASAIAAITSVKARQVFEADPRVKNVRASAEVTGSTVNLTVQMQAINGSVVSVSTT